jgi:hypothetical protein
MEYLDFRRLEALDPARFQERDPYPWVNPENLLVPAAFERLQANLPDVGMFDRLFDKKRRAGQTPHDRYALEYRDGIPVPEPWLEFIAELKGDRYRRALCRLVGLQSLSISFHWHYTPNGCSVSPHCDSTRKIGSHIFYFNTTEDWDPAWGGETVVLDDGGRLHPRSAPPFEAFDRALPSQSLGNRSLIFTRRGNSWHGVREIRCPEGHMRRVFIVVLNRDGLADRVRFALTRRNVTRY